MSYSRYTWLRNLLWTLVFGLLAAMLTIAICTSVHADGLTVTTVSDQVGIVPGQVVSITSTLTNTYAVAPPIELTATATWQCGLMPSETTTAGVTLSLTKPVMVPSYNLPLGSNFAYVAGSAKVDGVTVELSGIPEQLTIPLAKTLTEGQATVVTFQLRAQ